MSSSDPKYDKSHYSWKAPSSQASQLIIDHTTETSTGTPIPSSPIPDTGLKDFGDQDLESPPALTKRSTFNYKHESEEFRKKSLADGADDEEATAAATAAPEGRRGSITSKPFRPSAQRTKSWDYRDKRGQMQMTQLEQDPGSKEGFSEV